MRLKASKILLAAGLASVTAFGGVMPAHAHAHKAAARPEPHHASLAREKTPKEKKLTRAAAHESSRNAKASARSAATTSSRRKHADEPELKLVGKHKHGAPEPAAKKGHTRQTHESARPAIKTRAESTPKHSDEPIAETAPAVQPATALPDIHVTHNRKQHLQTPRGDSPDMPDSPVSAVPRKATPSDFLSATPAGPAAPTAEHASGAAKAKAFVPTFTPSTAPVVRAVLRKAAEKSTQTVLATAKAPADKELVAKLPEPAPVLLPALYNKRGKLIVPAALKGSHDILVHQNLMADQDGLDRIQDDADLDKMRSSKLLVEIPQNAGIRVDERLAVNRRYTRPWTASFLTALAKAHYDRFHSALQVNSAVRTVEFQHKLIRTNGNAAPAEGETASPHLTGQAVDLAKKGLSLTEVAWLRGYLLPLVQEGKVDVEEEFQQSCFHISVYRKFVPEAGPSRTITPHRSAATAIAAVIR